jgi:hypothetical protein
LLQRGRSLPPAQARRAEIEIRRIAQMSLLGDVALLCAAHVGVILDCSFRAVTLLQCRGRLPKPIQFGDLVRWRLQDIRDRVWAGVPLDEFPPRAPVRPEVPPLADDALLSNEHFALILGCSVRTVEKLRKAGRLPPAVPGAIPLRCPLLEVRLWVMRGC